MAVVQPRSARTSDIPEVHFGEEGILGTRPAADYNPAEREYSALLAQRINQLLRGQRNQLMLLRKYPDDPSRVGAMATPPELERSALRIPVIEKMATDALVFLTDRSPGGPVAQQSDGNGHLVERRQYPTKYPHIVIERTDVYAGSSERPESIQWCARRVQNQRASTQINRMLDAANLGLDVVRFILH